jgi:hypothetical protein
MKFFKEAIEWIVVSFLIVSAILAGMFLFICIITVITDWHTKNQCLKEWSLSGFESQYSHYTGCLIKVNNHWIPDRNYREILTKE